MWVESLVTLNLFQGLNEMLKQVQHDPTIKIKCYELLDYKLKSKSVNPTDFASSR